MRNTPKQEHITHKWKPLKNLYYLAKSWIECSWIFRDHNRAGTKEKSQLPAKKQIIQMCLQRVFWGGCLEHFYLIIQAAVTFCTKWKSSDLQAGHAAGWLLSNLHQGRKVTRNKCVLPLCPQSRKWIEYFQRFRMHFETKTKQLRCKQCWRFPGVS